METAEMNITSIDQLDFSKSYTYADYLMWKVEERLELIKGKIFKMSPAPSRKHQEIVGDIYFSFRSVFKNDSCKLFIAPFDVRLERKNENETISVVQPDVCIVCDPEKLDERGCNGAPDLIVEVLSPGNSKKEMDQKFRLYEESGVREYWMIEPEDECVFIYTLEKGKYIGLPPAVNTAESVVFPELKVDLKTIF